MKRTMEQHDDELEKLCTKLNPIYEAYVRYKTRYAQILDYFRVQLHRGNIAQEEYHERANKFVGYKGKR